MSTNNIKLLDVNPLERITGDIAISQHNYESIMNALVQWDNNKQDYITVRLATRTDPYFVDYVIHTKYYYDKNYGGLNSSVLLTENSFAYKNRLRMSVSVGDPITLRVNAENNGNTAWKVYEDVAVENEYESAPTLEDNVEYVASSTHIKHSYDKKGLYFRLYDQVNKQFVLYKTLTTIDLIRHPDDGEIVGETNEKLVVKISGVNTDFAVRVCVDTTSLHPYNVGYDFYYSYKTNKPTNGIMYARRAYTEIDANEPFSSSASGYENFCKMYDSAKTYNEGDVVYYLGEFYVSVIGNPTVPPASVIDRNNNTDLSGYDTYMRNVGAWERVLLRPFSNKVITGSGAIRAESDTDVQGYVLRNVGTSTSGAFTSISLMGTISIPGNDSAQAKGVNILSTSNYTNWPEDRAAKWSEGSSYWTDPNISSFGKQSYSAVMTFKHFGDDENYCYKNIINYDGPDVDQGLCILLPVTITNENNVTCDPSDGSMIEFLFNIWPNHKYDGRNVNDLVINKSQIYVYSVPDYSEYQMRGFNVDTVQPIAKFSMARLVNFYVFNENVGVPDRPVCYKARFIYSKAEHRWKTYDYYQFPDHIFVSPHGFVDPSEPNAYGVQTAGFPLYQNPFSNYNLNAIHVDSGYRNQIQNPDKSLDD